MAHTLLYIKNVSGCNICKVFPLLSSALGQENFKCPDDFGFYPHHISCDKYWKCDNNAAELKTCGNGLAFDAGDSKFLTENCDYLHNVECGDRTQLGTYTITIFLQILIKSLKSHRTSNLHDTLRTAIRHLRRREEMRRLLELLERRSVQISMLTRPRLRP